MDSIFDRMNLPNEAEVCVIEPPEDYPHRGADPFTETPGSEFDAVQVYVKQPEMFAEQVAEGERLRKKEGMLWVAYPTDQTEAFSEDFMREQGKPLGLQPVETINLDERWDARRMEAIS